MITTVLLLIIPLLKRETMNTTNLEMSNRLSDTIDNLLESIKHENPDKTREYLQLFIIQFELYREMIGNYDRGV